MGISHINVILIYVHFECFCVVIILSRFCRSIAIFVSVMDNAYAKCFSIYFHEELSVAASG